MKTIFYVYFGFCLLLKIDQSNFPNGDYYSCSGNPKIIEALHLNKEHQFYWNFCVIPCINNRSLIGTYEVIDDKLYLYPKQFSFSPHPTDSLSGVVSHAIHHTSHLTVESNDRSTTPVDSIHHQIKIRGSDQIKRRVVPVSKAYLSAFFAGEKRLLPVYQISSSPTETFLSIPGENGQVIHKFCQ